MAVVPANLSLADLDTRRLRSELAELTRLADGFGRTMASAFAGAVIGGRRLTDVLKSLALALSRQALTAALRPLTSALAGFAGALVGPVISGRGNVVAGGRVTPFAAGGIVTGPTLFALRSGLGLMGERGAEAILPLARGADGRLGVRAEGDRPVLVTVNIATPDVAGFQRSQSQLAAAIARAVTRGGRNL